MLGNIDLHYAKIMKVRYIVESLWNRNSTGILSGRKMTESGKCSIVRLSPLPSYHYVSHCWLMSKIPFWANGYCCRFLTSPNTRFQTHSELQPPPSFIVFHSQNDRCSCPNEPLFLTISLASTCNSWLAGMACKRQLSSAQALKVVAHRTAAMTAMTMAMRDVFVKCERLEISSKCSEIQMFRDAQVQFSRPTLKIERTAVDVVKCSS